MNMRRRGFTLIEMLLTVGLTVVVATELVTVFVGLFQMEKQKMWDSELATKLRVARENLLFRAIPAEGARHYAGILSATNLVWSSPHITAAFQYADVDGKMGYGQNEDVSERFLVQNVDDGEEDVPPVYITNNMFFVNTKVNLVVRQDPSTGKVLETTNRAERIAVPFFGKSNDGAWMEFMEIDPGESSLRWLP